MRLFLIGFLVMTGAACSEPEVTPQQTNQLLEGARELPKEMPPGFLDEAPPGPVSNTVVLSGGTLMSEPPITDSAVVITDGLIVAWGKREQVTMPNDSIGKDMRGKWLVPGTTAMLESGAGADQNLLQQGKPGNLLVLTVDPGLTRPGSEHLAGFVADGEIRIEDGAD